MPRQGWLLQYIYQGASTVLSQLQAASSAYTYIVYAVFYMIDINYDKELM